MRRLIWISYDLGVTGDYEAIYQWLDDHQAKECGDSLAAIQYEWARGDLFAALKKDLKKSLKQVSKNYRVYAIFSDGKTTRGKFVFGRRRAASWEGYGVQHAGPDEDV